MSALDLYPVMPSSNFDISPFFSFEIASRAPRLELGEHRPLMKARIVVCTQRFGPLELQCGVPELAAVRVKHYNEMGRCQPRTN